MKYLLVSAFSFILFSIVANAQQGWVSQTSPLGSEILGGVQFVSSTEGWIEAGNGRLLHTTDSGQNWSVVAACGTDTVEFISDPSRSMSFIDAKTGFLIGTLGSDTAAAMGAVLYKTTDGGSSWNKQSLNSWSMGFFVQFVDVNNGWAVVANGTNMSNITGSAVIHTTDAGKSWTTLPAGGIPYFVDANNGWLISAGPHGVSVKYIQHTTDGGGSWSTQLTDSTDGDFNALQFVDADNGWVIGNSGKIFHTTDGGVNWMRLTNTGNNSNHKALFFLDSMNGWIGGRTGSGDQGPGIILHTTDGGSIWTVQSTPFPYGIFGIYFINSQTGWATSDYGALANMTGGATSVRQSGSSSPITFGLRQNFPNPFNPATVINYSIPEKSFVVLKVYNILGKEVAELVNREKAAGKYSVEFDASRLTSGVYLYKLDAGKYTDTKKLVLLK